MKNKILLIITIAIVLIAVCVVIFVPKNNESKNTKTSETYITKRNTTSNDSSSSNSETKFSAKEATLTENGDVNILTDDLSTSKASFIRFASASGETVELAAVKNSNNGVDVAFNTCQSCNGSPRAYFIQTSSGKLECQNCGNQYPVSSIGTQIGAGCNPMTIDPSNYTITENGIEISKEFLNENASLFSNVIEH